MKNRLYTIMSDAEEITKQLDDILNIIELQLLIPCDEKQILKLNSLLRAQFRLLKETKEISEKLHIEIDETILDMIHNRL